MVPRPPPGSSRARLPVRVVDRSSGVRRSVLPRRGRTSLSYLDAGRQGTGSAAREPPVDAVEVAVGAHAFVRGGGEVRRDGALGVAHADLDADERRPEPLEVEP